MRFRVTLQTFSSWRQSMPRSAKGQRINDDGHPITLLEVPELPNRVSKQRVVSRVVAYVARRWRTDVLRFRILINRRL